jgi:mRNA-degrading endonuclease toxin of MazEF toxin-antitoxin module
MSVDKSEIVNGGIYRVRDSEIDFPETQWSRRGLHAFRTVVVVSADHLCRSDELVVSAAPMSTDLSLQHPTDVIVFKNPENGLNKDGRVLLGHIQPIRKDALEKKFGRMSDEDWQTILVKIVDNFDRE